jgi:phosphoribosylanthranilate isomerase
MFAQEDSTVPGRVRVKICGITTLADALAAIHCGADALGFNFFPGSKRYLDPRTNSDWIMTLPGHVTRVAVLVDPAWEDLLAVAALPFIDVVQLHGHESPEFCRRVAESGIRFAKAIAVAVPGWSGTIPNFFTDTVLLDSGSRRGFGGTGETFDWVAGRQFVEQHPGLKVVVAGGLTVENVAEAVRTMRPFGVDVTTGVESSPRRKDPARVRDFIRAVRGL